VPDGETKAEPIGRRHRVEPQPQPVAAGQARRGQRSEVETQLSAAVGDLDRAVDRQQWRRPVTGGSTSSRSMRSRPTSMSMSGNNGALGSAARSAASRCSLASGIVSDSMSI
jgi:hypothetical protein